MCFNFCLDLEFSFRFEVLFICWVERFGLLFGFGDSFVSEVLFGFGILFGFRVMFVFGVFVCM